jgi:3-oxoadipate enol-lactonase
MPTLTVEGASLSYADDDFADPWRPRSVVALQHGFGRNGNFWRGWVPYLSRDHRVIRADIRGCGASRVTDATGAYSLDLLVGDLIAILDAARIDRVHFVGESIGGMLGVAIAARSPKRIRSLTLISTPFSAGGGTAPLQALGYENWHAALRALGMREWWVRSRAAAGEVSDDPRRDEYFADEFSRTTLEAGLRLADFSMSESVADLAKNVSVPTLILAPSRAGSQTSPEQQRAIASAIPGATQRVYEGGRGAFYQNPDELARLVAGWIHEREAQPVDGRGTVSPAEIASAH